MQLTQTLAAAATAAQNRRKLRYYRETGTDPDDEPHNPLMGYCVENTRELSWELAQRHIPHRIVRGAIAFDAVEHYPYWLLDDDDTLPDKHEQAIAEIVPNTASDTGRVPLNLWERIPAPQTVAELPDEARHYWVEVDANETIFQSNGIFTVETAAEAREHYAEPTVYTGRPDEYYIQLTEEDENSYPRLWDNLDWDWKPRDPQPY